jgi:hypothetical protein
MAVNALRTRGESALFKFIHFSGEGKTIFGK